VPHACRAVLKKERYLGQGVEAANYADLLATHKPDSRPVRQARGNAQWLRNFLKEKTHKSFDVMAVVVFPGWFIPPDSGNRLRHLGIESGDAIWEDSTATDPPVRSRVRHGGGLPQNLRYRNQHLACLRRANPIVLMWPRR
jgi:hypothetical protein